MPRNPNKTRCQVAGCRNWAMRGHTRCRAHRDAELGPRPVGAPSGNLNALKTGRHAHPLPLPHLSSLARQLVDEPHLLPYHLGLTAQSILARTKDPHQALLAFRATLADLEPLVAHHQFVAEFLVLLEQVPSSRRASVAALILDQVRAYSPQQRLLAFRKAVALTTLHRQPPTSVVPPAPTVRDAR